MHFTQNIDQPVDVADWAVVDEYEQYPEGARPKTLLLSPHSVSFNFLRANHRYLFKLSDHRYPEQFWIEIFAYRLGQIMGINVPPAFVAYDSSENQAAALIEWFVFSETEEAIAGGDYCTRYILDFDRKKGVKHNFQSVKKIFNDLESENHVILNWQKYWAQAFLFDALIGNTDRHQDNWSIIQDKKNNKIRISPVFDNGTSMGHEINNANFKNKLAHLDAYIAKGWHHMRWALGGPKLKHPELLALFINEYPESREVMLRCLRSINTDILEEIVNTLAQFDIPMRLTSERASFMLKLVDRRHQLLLKMFEQL